MNPHDQPPPEALLQAWVDDRLPESDQRRVDHYLDANPAVAARLRRYREQAVGLRVAMQSRFPDGASQGLAGEALAGARRRVAAASQLGRVAALVGALVFGALAGGGGVAVWTRAAIPWPAPGIEATLASDAFLAHRTYTEEVRHFVEVAASEQHLMPWLSNRLGSRVAAPDLAALGYSLIGGRVLPTPEGQAAQLMYEDSAGVRLTIYLRKGGPTGDTTLHFETRDGVNGFWWTEQGFGYALFAALDRPRLLAVANAIQKQVRV